MKYDCSRQPLEEDFGKRVGAAALDWSDSIILKGVGLAVASIKHNPASMSLNLMTDKDDLLLN